MAARARVPRERTDDLKRRIKTERLDRELASQKGAIERRFGPLALSEGQGQDRVT